MSEIISKLFNSKTNGSNIKIDNLLSTEVWVPVMKDGKMVQSTDLNISANPNKLRIVDALANLSQRNIRAVKRNTSNYGKIYVVDEQQAEKAYVGAMARFINQKAYVLNSRLNNTFIWDELKLNKVSKTPQTYSLKGGSNETNFNGELAAIKNTIVMSGGNNNLTNAKSLQKLDLAIKNNLQKGNLTLKEEDKERISILFKKVSKYLERLNMIGSYLAAYNDLPDDKKKR